MKQFSTDMFKDRKCFHNFFMPTSDFIIWIFKDAQRHSDLGKLQSGNINIMFYNVDKNCFSYNHCNVFYFLGRMFWQNYCTCWNQVSIIFSYFILSKWVLVISIILYCNCKLEHTLSPNFHNNIFLFHFNNF